MACNPALSKTINCPAPEPVDDGRRSAYCPLKLETGILQPEAIGLYRSSGFIDGECFGEHQPDPLSIYLHKDLGA